ncbi:hypothetical protein Lalb_Chr22g0359641 [Lupinus albus]|uniref:Uncharacterized protein n=1 Tax=Lupinus albus TaxID=3870 RepID=A0A6A4NDG5_LUPAL|nr:hypothetical protein Lalb_Chr22g0359641 [Lupinus albus]
MFLPCRPLALRRSHVLAAETQHSVGLPCSFRWRIVGDAKGNRQKAGTLSRADYHLLSSEHTTSPVVDEGEARLEGV